MRHGDGSSFVVVAAGNVRDGSLPVGAYFKRADCLWRCVSIEKDHVTLSGPIPCRGIIVVDMSKFQNEFEAVTVQP